MGTVYNGIISSYGLRMVYDIVKQGLQDAFSLHRKQAALLHSTSRVCRTCPLAESTVEANGKTLIPDGGKSLEESCGQNMDAQHISMQSLHDEDLWTVSFPMSEMRQLADVIRKHLQLNRMESWLAKEREAYGERDDALYDENEKRIRLLERLDENLPASAEEAPITESVRALRNKILVLEAELEEANKTREELGKKINLVEETIHAERSEQTARWGQAMRGLQDRLKAAGMLEPTLEQYNEARNRLPAAFRHWANDGEKILQRFRHRDIIKQRDTGNGSIQSDQGPSIPSRLESAAAKHNEIKHEYDRARYEFEQRQETYRYRLGKYEEMLAQGLDVPSKSEFDREWLLELSRLTGDFLAAETDLKLSRGRLKRFFPESIVVSESILDQPDHNHHGTSEYWIHEGHREEIVSAWLSRVPQVVGQLAGTDQPMTPPSSQYSADTLPFGFAESGVKLSEYGRSRAKAYAEMVRKRGGYESVAGSKRPSESDDEASIPKRHRNGA